MIKFYLYYLGLAWLLPLGIIIFFIFLLIFYLNDNPPNKSSSAISYPYALSVKPALLAKGESAEISFSYLQGELDTKNSTTMLVVGPSGKVFPSKVGITSNLAVLTFPFDFNNASSTELGNYSILVLSDNKIVNRLSFKIILYPPISSFNDFLFGSGLSLMIGLFASIITFVYQHTSQANKDQLRRSEEKAKWINTNGKYYTNLIEDSWNISNFFRLRIINGQEHLLISLDPDHLLYLIIKFLYDHNSFKTSLNMYYFDDFISENFLYNLDSLIVKFLGKLFDDHSILTKFFDKEYYQLLTDIGFQQESQRLLNWLIEQKNINDIKIFYLNYLVHSWVLYVSVNRDAMVTYSSPSQIKKNIYNLMDNAIQKKSFRSHLEYLNKKFYEENCALYYRIFNSKGELDLNRINDGRSYLEPLNKIFKRIHS